ncbi:MAG: DNA polymerase domain-containing protein [Candidatus Heimdallarchaeota archaeon]
MSLSSQETILFTLIDLDYETYSSPLGQRPRLRLWGRAGHKIVEVRVINFLPYFYAQTTVEKVRVLLSKANQQIKDWVLEIIPFDRRIYFGGDRIKLVRLVGTLPYQVPLIRQFLEEHQVVTHEADIPFTRRFLIDRNLRALHPIRASGRITESKSSSIVMETEVANITAEESNMDFQPLVLAFDIEVDEQGETIQELMDEKRRRITAISLAWGRFPTEHPDSKVLILRTETDDAEREILEEFLYLIRSTIRPDIMVSFNGTFFDIPYLESRLKRYGKSLGSLTLFEGLQDTILKVNIPVESYRLKGRGVVDLMPKTWHIHPVSGKKNLETIANYVLGESKIAVPTSLGALWRKGVRGDEESMQQFHNYSLQDAILTFRLVGELGIIDTLELCRLVGYPLPEGLLSTARQIGEYELYRILYENEILIPSKPSHTELKQRQELKRKHPHLGGWVIDPTVSQATFVAILDFRSLYPNLVRVHNISGETLIHGSENLPPVERFRKTPQGALAKLMDRILKQRYKVLQELDQVPETLDTEIQGNLKKMLKRQEISLKLMANSLYGSSNYPRGRFYHHLMSNSITAIARELLGVKLQKWTEDFAVQQPYGVTLLYGDTDSIFIEFQLGLNPQEFSWPAKQSITPLLNAIDLYRKFLAEKLPEFLELKLEDIALRIILKEGRKKAYAYYSLLSGDIIIKGFEAVRSDWSPLAKKTQRQLLETLLTDFTNNRDHKAQNVVVEACRTILTKSMSQLFEDLTIRGPLRKAPSKYRTKTPAVGAFLKYCARNKLDPEEEWKRWDGFPYIIAKGPIGKPQYLRAYHPDVFHNKRHKPDRRHYVREILGASERFGITFSENEILHRIFVVPLTEFLAID